MARKTQAPDTQFAVIYARYSSHSQNDASIEQQVADCEAFARMNNLEIVKVYADRHLTGTNDKRPEFQRMLREAERGHWQYVITWKVDRFARNRYDSATYKYRLKKHGVKVLYAKEAIPDGPEGILLESVLEGSAEYYSANLSQNVRRGMHFNALDCKVNSGSLPYGYRKGPDGKFEIHEAQAEIVREIFHKVSIGTPFVDIINDLNGRGIKTRSGGLWNRSSFQNMLHNESYIGVYHFSDVRIEGGVPAIVKPEIFWEVDRRLKTKKNAQGRKREGNEYLLTGKLFCGPCGSHMVGISGTGHLGQLHYYYSCQRRRLEKDCKKKHVRQDYIERVVVDSTLRYVLQPSVIQWIADAVMAYQEREGASAELSMLQEQKAENEKATANLMKAIEMGIITENTKRRLLELEHEAVELKRSIDLEIASHTHLEREQIIYWMERFRDGDRKSQEFRRKVIDSFVNAVYLWDDHIKIAFNYSGKNNTISRELVMDAETVAGESQSYRLCDGLPQTWPGIPWNSGLFSCFVVVGCGLWCRSLWRIFCALFVSGRIRF